MKKVTGQIVISVEQPAKMFYALGLSPTSKKELLLGLKPEMRNDPSSAFKVIFTGGKATVETDGKYNGGDGKFVAAHLTMTLFGIGSLNPTGNPLGEMKVGFTVIAMPTKTVLWKSDVKKVTNGYVRVEAPE